MLILEEKLRDHSFLRGKVRPESRLCDFLQSTAVSRHHRLTHIAIKGMPVFNPTSYILQDRKV